MRWRRKTKYQNDNAGQQRIADAIVRRIIALQLRWALRMQRSTERMPVKVRKVVFIIFFFIGILYCLDLIVSGFTGKRDILLSIQSIHLPITADEKKQQYSIISEEEFQNIEWFKSTIDSLQKTVDGKHIADSILTARPGLMDSVAAFETLYQSIRQRHSTSIH